MVTKNPQNGFRRLYPDELDIGYAVLVDAYEYLKSKGSSQWPQPFPHEKYRRWHAQGLNYGYFSDGTLAAVLSLVEETDDRWRDFLSGECVWWVRAVAGANQHRNNGFGCLAIRAAVDRIVTGHRLPLFLHCFKGNGFLPGYYGRLGFEALSETELDNGPWVLLKYPVQSPYRRAYLPTNDYHRAGKQGFR